MPGTGVRLLARLPDAQWAAQGRILPALAIWPARYLRDDFRQQLADAVSRSRDAVAVVVCAGRLRPQFARLRRGGDEVLRAWRYRVGRISVRCLTRLWRVGHDPVR